jgi:hypothetical protein
VGQIGGTAGGTAFPVVEFTSGDYSHHLQ